MAPPWEKPASTMRAAAMPRVRSRAISASTCACDRRTPGRSARACSSASRMSYHARITHAVVDRHRHHRRMRKEEAHRHRRRQAEGVHRLRPAVAVVAQAVHPDDGRIRIRRGLDFDGGEDVGHVRVVKGRQGSDSNCAGRVNRIRDDARRNSSLTPEREPRRRNFKGSSPTGSDSHFAKPAKCESDPCVTCSTSPRSPPSSAARRAGAPRSA